MTQQQRPAHTRPAAGDVHRRGGGRSTRAAAAIAGLATLLLSLSAAAGPGAQVLACAHLDQATCPALTLALKAPSAPAEEIAAVLLDPKTSAPMAAKAGVALGILRGKAAAATLLKAAQARPADSDVAVTLLGAAARAGAQGAQAGLSRALNGDKPQHQVVAAGALALLGHRPAAPRLRQLLSAPTPRLQAAAALALQSLGGPADVPALLKLASAPDTYAPARRNALAALAKLGPVQARVTAARLVDHPTRSIGRAALDVIAAAPARWTQPVITFGLQTPGLRGRAALAAAAGKSGGRQVLVAALALDLSDRERTWVLHALTRLKPLGAGSALMGRFDKLPAKAQIEVLKTLPALADQTVVPALVTQLQKAQRPVANYVVYALENVTGQRLGESVAAWRSYAGMDKPTGAQPDAAPPAPSAAPPTAAR